MITPEGDYLSNLQAPDLRPFFKHLHWRKMGHSMGHLVASDWADKPEDDPFFGIYKNCGLWTRDEAAILFHLATSCMGNWLDIGAHTGWTSANIAAACCAVDAVDPMLSTIGFQERFEDNLAHCWRFVNQVHGATSSAYFFNAGSIDRFAGICIDGDHEPGKPLEDAQNAVKHLSDRGVVVFHDFIGAPVREAVTWLMGHEDSCAVTHHRVEGTSREWICNCKRGFKARVYWTPHLVAVCWRGDFNPPDHDADPRIDWSAHRAEMWRDFDFGRLS